MRKLLLLLAFVAAAVLAQSEWPPQGMKCPERTVVVLKVDSARSGKLRELYASHVAFLRPLMKSGKIVSAGPTDGDVAIMLLATRDWSEVQELLKNEPYMSGGLLTVANHYVWQACEAAQ